MGVVGWLKSFLGDSRLNRRQKAPPPSEAELQAAIARLDQMVKPALFGEIGGVRPGRSGQPSSWWGGQFFGAEGEGVPIGQGTGRAMRPLVQIRTDEVPEPPAWLAGIALVTIWVDVKAVFGDHDRPGTGFAIRTYATLDGLVPMGPGSQGGRDLPVFPIAWRGPVADQPSWEDFADEIPASVAQSNEEGWFFESRYAAQAEALSEICPVKLGGWPNWIQGGNWPDDGEFCLQVNATDKGRFSLGDGGSLYIFRTPRAWASRSDCY